MPYFVNKHILFIHIPKTGGTAIEEALLKNDNIILHSLGKRSNTLFPRKEINEHIAPTSSVWSIRKIQ